jgi:hypothetical protein
MDSFQAWDTKSLFLDIEITKKEVEEAEGTRTEIIIKSVKFLGEERLCKEHDEVQILRGAFTRG